MARYQFNEEEARTDWSAWGSRVCASEVSGHGCAPAWLALVAAVLLVVVGGWLLVLAARRDP